MKRLLLSILLFTASQEVLAQECNAYLPEDIGTTWVITNYNKRDKEQGSVAYELLDKQESETGIVFVVKNDAYDKKGKEIFSNTFEARCAGGEFDLGLSMKLDGSALQQYQNMDMSIDASDYIIPSMDTPPGTSLPDASMSVSVAGGGPINLNMTISIDNRVVEAIEEIETPAGVFTALVMTQDIGTHMIINVQSTTKEWYVQGLGMVRSETYNKRGNLTGYSELTEYHQPL